MCKRFLAGTFLAGLLVPVCAPAQGGVPSRTRVTIRNDGGNVVIERTQTTAPKPSTVSEWTPGPLDVAADMKAAGSSDAELLSYLSAHAAELPAVIDSEDVRRLRKAGAGKEIVAYLARVSAVEIGETGEGHEAPEYGPATAPVLEPTNGIPYDAYAYGGGYYPPYLPGLGRPGFPGHSIHQGKHTGSPRGRPAFHAGSHPRETFSRLPAYLRRQP